MQEPGCCKSSHLSRTGTPAIALREALVFMGVRAVTSFGSFLNRSIPDGLISPFQRNLSSLTGPDAHQLRLLRLKSLESRGNHHRPVGQ